MRTATESERDFKRIDGLTLTPSVHVVTDTSGSCECANLDVFFSYVVDKLKLQSLQTRRTTCMSY